ncbi:MAG: tetratricopeptide repeat protein [Chloroflexi bacterium]|nr:tetratricopeptide repeat protein [Chloroflexota bacterium]
MNIRDLAKKIQNFFSETNQIRRIVIYAAIALGLALMSFGGYYYWDRYVHLGDESPVSMSINELERAAQEHPDNIEIRLALAESYMLDTQYDRAIQQASVVLNAYPDNERAMFIVGVGYASSGRPEESLAPLEKFTKIRAAAPTASLDSSLETALFYLGNSYINLGRYEEAIPKLSQALTINSTDADAFYLLGQAYTETGQHEQAVQNYQEAVRFVPNFAEAYQGMAESYTALDRPEYAAYARGMVAFSKGNYSAARRDLEHAAQTLSDYAPLYVGLGLACEELGDLASAEAHLKRALEIDPYDFTATQALGRVQSVMQK